MKYYVEYSSTGKCGVRSSFYRVYEGKTKTQIRANNKGTGRRIEHIWSESDLDNLKAGAKEKIIKKAW